MKTRVHFLFILWLIFWDVLLGAAGHGLQVPFTSSPVALSPSLTSQRSLDTITLLQSAGKRLFARRASAAVALTFDDGPDPVFTPQVLATLERYGVHATFFCLGSLVQEYPAVVQQAFQQGNQIGNHSWNHPRLTTLSSDGIRWQLRSTSTVIYQTTGEMPRLFRPPYGATNGIVSGIADQLGLVQVEWTVNPGDWQRPGVPVLVRTVLSEARPGSIILMHDGGGDRSQTVQALPQIIQGLQQRGFALTLL